MGSSCSTLPRLCPACKTRTGRCVLGNKLVVAQYSRLEPASTGQSRRGGAPRRGVVWFSHRLFSSKCGCSGLGRVGSLSVTFFVSERAGWVGSVSSFCDPH